MSRGDDRKKIFTRSADCNKFMDYVVKAKERYQFYLYAYCLMPNHFHLLLETLLPNISRIMHCIKGSYTTYYNVRYQRYGHLFQGRFKSIIVDKDRYFLELSRYIHLNPVHAGIVEDPSSYAWSSYRGYLGRKDIYLDRDQMRRYCDVERSEYRRFVLDGVEKSKDLLNKVYAGLILGSTTFIKEQLKGLEIQSSNEEIIHKKALIGDQEKAERIIQAVETNFHTTLVHLRKAKTRPMREKQILIYLLRTYTGMTNQAIGDIVGMRYPAVSKARHTVERLLIKDKQLKHTVDKIVSSFQV